MLFVPRKSLAAKLAFHDAVDELRTQLRHAGGGDRFHAVENWLLTRIDQTHVLDGRLDVFMQGLRAEFADAVRLDLNDNQGELYKRVLHRTATAFDIDCDACARETPLPVCDGADPDRDDELVAARGFCLSPLRRIHHAIARLAEALYAAVLPGDRHVALALSTAYEGYPVGRLNPVAGLTRFHDDADLRQTEVMLQANHKEFSEASYAAIPYVLSHEYIVHAYQGLASEETPRPHSEGSDAWLEGWMDFVAYTTLARGVAASSTEWPTKVHEAAYEIRTRRFLDEDFGGAREQGDRGARRTLDLFIEKLGDREAGTCEFLKFSAEMTLLWCEDGYWHGEIAVTLDGLLGGRQGNPTEADERRRNRDTAWAIITELRATRDFRGACGKLQEAAGLNLRPRELL